jgi:hypothetical protein
MKKLHSAIAVLTLSLLGASAQAKDIDMRKIDGFEAEPGKFANRVIRDVKSLKSFLDTHSVKVFDGAGKVVEPAMPVAFDKELVVHFRETTPGRDCVVSMILTSPSALVAVQKSAKKVRFIGKKWVQSCDKAPESSPAE